MFKRLPTDRGFPRLQHWDVRSFGFWKFFWGNKMIAGTWTLGLQDPDAKGKGWQGVWTLASIPWGTRVESGQYISRASASVQRVYYDCWPLLSIAAFPVAIIGSIFVGKHYSKAYLVGALLPKPEKNFINPSSMNHNQSWSGWFPYCINHYAS